MKSKVKRKKVYFITVVIGFAICMVGVIFGSRLVFQRTCERRTTPWSDLGTADDDEYRILIDAYKIKNQSNETVMIQAFDNTKLIGHYYEREKGAPLIVFFHGLWGHSYLDGVPIYRITQKHNWNLLLCDLRAQGDSEGEFSTLGVLEKYDCLDWVEWAQNRFGDKNPIFLMGVSMGASIVMMSSDLELPDSVYGIIDDCGFTSTLDVIKQNNNKKISKYIPKNLFPTMLNTEAPMLSSFKHKGILFVGLMKQSKSNMVEKGQPWSFAGKTRAGFLFYRECSFFRDCCCLRCTSRSVPRMLSTLAHTVWSSLW